MSDERMDPTRLRELRDRALLYVYENAADRFFNVDLREIAQALGTTQFELRPVVNLLLSQGLFGNRFTAMSDFGISDAGMREAERLGPLVAMRENQDPKHVTIHANYSVVQVAGSHSSQSASLTIQQTQIEQVLNEIESTLPSLNISDAKKDEAKGLVTSLRQGLTAKLSDAGLRAIGGALGSILIAAGSPLGQRLMELLRIAVGG